MDWHAATAGADGRTIILADPPPRLPDGPFAVAVRSPRSAARHRHYWGMLRSVADATGMWSSPEQLHRWLKLELGLYSLVEYAPGERAFEWHSTADMGEREFGAHLDAAKAVIVLETGIDPDDL